MAKDGAPKPWRRSRDTVSLEGPYNSIADLVGPRPICERYWPSPNLVDAARARMTDPPLENASCPLGIACRCVHGIGPALSPIVEEDSDPAWQVGRRNCAPNCALTGVYPRQTPSLTGKHAGTS